MYRTTDGGKTWERTLFVDENTGCSDVGDGSEQSAHPVRWHVAARDPHVGTQRAAVRAAACSRRGDGGTTWTTSRRATGCPRKTVGKVGARHRAVQLRTAIYALIETGDGIPMPTTDSRLTADSCGVPTTAARTVADDERRSERHAAGPHYYARMAVAPDNADEVYFLNRPSFSKSIDGGAHDHAHQSPASRRLAAITTTSGSIRPTPTA